MTVSLSAAATAGASFVVLVVVAYAGADHPPPTGFWLLVGLLAAWSGWLGVLVRLFLAARGTRSAPRRWALLASGGGAGAGAIVAVLVAVQLARSVDVSADVVIGVAAALLGGVAWACVGGALATAMAARANHGS